MAIGLKENREPQGLPEKAKKYANRPLPGVPQIVKKDIDTSTETSSVYSDIEYYEREEEKPKKKRRIALFLVGTGIILCACAAVGAGVASYLLSGAESSVNLNLTGVNFTPERNNTLAPAPFTTDSVVTTAPVSTEGTTEVTSEPTTVFTTAPTTVFTTEPITTEETTTVAPTTQATCGMGALVMNGMYFTRGVDILSMIVDSIAACIQLCLNTPKCGIGSYYKRSRGCWLSENVRLLGFEDFWMAFILSDSCTCEMIDFSGGGYLFVVPPGNPARIHVRLSKANSSDHCSSQCRWDNDCAAAQFNAEEKVCEIFDQVPLMDLTWMTFDNYIKGIGCFNVLTTLPTTAVSQMTTFPMTVSKEMTTLPRSNVSSGTSIPRSDVSAGTSIPRSRPSATMIPTTFAASDGTKLQGTTPLQTMTTSITGNVTGFSDSQALNGTFLSISNNSQGITEPGDSGVTSRSFLNITIDE